VSLAKNIEFLRHLRRMPAVNVEGFGRGIRSPLIETTGFGTNPGAYTPSGYHT